MNNSPQTGNPTKVVVGRPKTTGEKSAKLARAVVSAPKPPPALSKR